MRRVNEAQQEFQHKLRVLTQTKDRKTQELLELRNVANHYSTKALQLLELGGERSIEEACKQLKYLRRASANTNTNPGFGGLRTREIEIKYNNSEANSSNNKRSNGNTDNPDDNGLDSSDKSDVYEAVKGKQKKGKYPCWKLYSNSLLLYTTS